MLQAGAAYEQDHQYDQAERAFRDLIAANPKNADALNYLGYMLAERGRNLDEAVSLVTRALALQADNPAFLDSLGWAYFKKTELDKAEGPLERAAAAVPRGSVIQEHLGDLLLRDEALRRRGRRIRSRALRRSRWHRRGGARQEARPRAESREQAVAGRRSAPWVLALAIAYPRPFVRRVRSLVAVGMAGCSSRRARPPCSRGRTGPGEPAADGAAIWRDARPAAGTFAAIAAMLDMSGSVGGHRIPHVKLGVAVDARGSVAIQARVVGPLLFSLGGTTRPRHVAARGWQSRRDRAGRRHHGGAHRRSKLTPLRLLGVLSGCVSPGGTFVRAERYGDVVDVTTSDADVFVARA